MKEENLIKTIRQYSHPLSDDIVSALLSIAEDYRKVKNYVYSRYAGIRSLSKLTPGYDIQNEMRGCGLRQQLNLPVVYYELAIFDAIKDIKSMWSNLKRKIRQLAAKNENLSADDRTYLYTVLQLDHIFAEILAGKKSDLPNNVKGLALDAGRLNRLLCRLVRRNKPSLATAVTNSFRVSPNGYSYTNGGIRIVGRVPRKRIFIPLKDNRTFTRQIHISVVDHTAILVIPVACKLKQHGDYVNTVFVHIGYRNLFTLSNGHIYGAGFNKRVAPETNRLAIKNQERYRIYRVYSKNFASQNWSKCRKIEQNNLGKKKYNALKKRKWAETATFINTEINRMLRTEKACKIVICKNIGAAPMGKISKRAREMLTRSFAGYIRRRLKYKCQLNEIELVEINPAGTAVFCSQCGGRGQRRNAEFVCESCGNRMDAACNAAKNIERKYYLRLTPT